MLSMHLRPCFQTQQFVGVLVQPLTVSTVGRREDKEKGYEMMTEGIHVIHDDKGTVAGKRVRTCEL